MRGHFLPGKYIQGPSILASCERFLFAKKSKILIIADSQVMPLIADFQNSVVKAGNGVVRFIFNGECSEEEIERAKADVLKNGISVVAGAGGGKAIDTARMIGYTMGLPIITIPTIAATNAATSSLVGIYSKDHIYKYPVKTGRCPDLVLADTEIIARAPVRFLVAGMGDCLSPLYEGAAMRKANVKTVHGTDCNDTAIAFSRMAHDTILEKGLMAKVSAENKTVTPALEDVVEAILMLSEAGAEGGGGTAVPHGLHAAFTVLPEVAAVQHGERVAFGIIVQMVLENRHIDEIENMLSFYKKVGLPLGLSDLKITGNVVEKLQKVVQKACEPQRYVHNMPFDVGEKDLFDAIIVADALGREYGAKSANRA